MDLKIILTQVVEFGTPTELMSKDEGLFASMMKSNSNGIRRDRDEEKEEGK